MRRVGYVPKYDYQKIIKPYIKKYNFVTKNYTYFTMDQYRIQFDDDKYNFSRKYFLFEVNKIFRRDIYIGYDVNVFINLLEKEMRRYIRKNKIDSLLK